MTFSPHSILWVEIVIEMHHPDLFFPFQIYKKEISFPRVDGTESVVPGTNNGALLYVLSTNETKNEALPADRYTVGKVGRKFVVTIASEYQLTLGKDFSVTVGFPSQRASNVELWWFLLLSTSCWKNSQCVDVLDALCFVAVRQQAITWPIVEYDLCRHMSSLDHNEVTY